MKITRFIAIMVIAGAIGLGAAQAQIREQQPAEFPPASYNGKQYVDSKGCVFIRAGIDGDVAWVPRVTRARKTICGFIPSLKGKQVAAAEPASAAKAPMQITLDNAPVAAAVATPKTVVRKAAKPRRVAAPGVVRQTAPKPHLAPKAVVVAQTSANPVVGRKTGRAATACPGASALSQQYLRRNKRLPVRCGPQAASITGLRVVRTTAATLQPNIATTTTPATGVVSDNITADTRIVPKHVAIRRINTADVSIPRGYKRVWEDGRLNPRRAEQTLGGRQQMLLIWTNSVPRRLINQATGKDLTATVPLVYPFLDVTTQRHELGEVTIVQRDGQLFKRIIRNTPARPAMRKPVYSTRSAPKHQVAQEPKARATTPAKSAQMGKRYVQIGLFSTSAKAKRAAGHVAGMGMPARIGKVRWNGKTYMRVQAGPFNGTQAIQRAMTRLRSVGYSGATVRN